MFGLAGKAVVGTLVLVAAVILVPRAVAAPGSATPTSVSISRTGGLAGDHIPPLATVRVTDPGLVRTLYQTVRTLPAMPAGVYNCPADVGVRYRLVFARRGRVELTAVVDANGCRTAILTPGQRPPRRTTPQFWSQLANALGVPPSQLHPTPR